MYDVWYMSLSLLISSSAYVENEWETILINLKETQRETSSKRISSRCVWSFQLLCDMCCSGGACKPLQGQPRVRWHSRGGCRSFRCSLKASVGDGRWHNYVPLTFYVLLPASSCCSWRCSITYCEGLWLWVQERAPAQQKSLFWGHLSGGFHYSDKWSANGKDWSAQVCSDTVLSWHNCIIITHTVIYLILSKIDQSIVYERI